MNAKRNRSRMADVCHKGDFRLEITFADNVTGVFDF
ncbi:MAG: hypothetical protein FD138_345 [Planctomycetota bacterium]|nr:MAG: hypothetical protein FD138_345 [Planctomycetota bacterium]